VRLEIEAGDSADVEQFLASALDLDPADVFPITGLLDATGLFQIYNLGGFSDIRDSPFVPAAVPAFTLAANPWAAIRARDILVHHPYESFAHVVEFIEAAANDDRVLALKQTLYRTSSDSPVVRALQRAADRGKQVTAVIELKARLDEERNILWAKELEKSGVHVVYGFIGLKTHCKVSLVVRREDDTSIRRYVHLATGNYNPQTARTYTDIGLFTSNPDFADDVSALFNYLTGYAELPQWRKLIVGAEPAADRDDSRRSSAKRRTRATARPAASWRSFNGLLEPAVVKALYKASQSGVRVDLVCRGICSLRPGLPGVSENIRVVSIVDRFLEHSRIFYFENGGQPEVFTGSADWMDRNLSRRVEVVFPIEQPDLKMRLIDEILKTTLSDNVKARELLPDGTYRRVTPGPGGGGGAQPAALPGAGGSGQPATGRGAVAGRNSGGAARRATRAEDEGPSDKRSWSTRLACSKKHARRVLHDRGSLSSPLDHSRQDHRRRGVRVRDRLWRRVGRVRLAIALPTHVPATERGGEKRQTENHGNSSHDRFHPE